MWADRSDTGVVGPVLMFRYGMIQHAGMVLGLYGSVGHIFAGMRLGAETPYGRSDWYRGFSSLKGACQVVRREVYEAVGGYDESYQLTVSDIDFCLRVEELGLRNMVNPFARLYHREAATRGRSGYSSDEVRALERRVYGATEDRHYNINLTKMVPTGVPKISEEPRLEELVTNFREAVDQYIVAPLAGEIVNLASSERTRLDGAGHVARGTLASG